MSETRGYPHGLANSSGMLGRNFMGHTLVTADALYDRRVNGYMGPNINGTINDYYDTDVDRGFVGGYTIVLRNAQLGPLGFHRKWAPANIFGHELYEFMNDWFGHSISVSAYGEQLPDENNTVTLDPDVKDTYGLPVPRIDIRLGENEHAMMRHAEQVLRSIIEESGGKQSRIKKHKAPMGTHLMGTARMGYDRERSVCNSFGQTHDIKNLFIADGSLFPTSTPANPTLTIQALATRVAFHIADRFSGGA